MLQRGGFDAKADRRRLCGTPAEADSIAVRIYTDPAKALVVELLSQLVTDGFAKWKMLDNGEVELRFSTGESFLLAQKTVLRLVQYTMRRSQPAERVTLGFSCPCTCANDFPI